MEDDLTKKVNKEYDKNEYINQSLNYEPEINDEEKSEETNRMRRNIKNLINSKKTGKKLNEDVEESKELFESINTTSDLKRQAYEYLSEVVGIDLYKTENRREIKKAYKILNDVKKDTKSLEKVLNGEEVYRSPSLNHEELLSYLSSIDPKKKGLYFLHNECRDITIMFRNQELEHKNYISKYESQLEEIDKQIEIAQNNKELDSLKELYKDKIDLKRKTELHLRDLDGIYNDLDNYIIRNKHLENKIYEYQNALNASRVLSNNMEFSLSIIEPDYMSGEGKTLNEAMSNLSKLQKTGSKFKKFIEEYAIQKNTKNDRLYKSIDKTVKDSNGEEVSKNILNKNKSVFDYSKANMKAMRDTYFEELGY